MTLVSFLDFEEDLQVQNVIHYQNRNQFQILKKETRRLDHREVESQFETKPVAPEVAPETTSPVVND